MLANNNVNDDNRPSQIINMFCRNFSPASHVLDLGCGRGFDAFFLVDQGFKVTAVDKAKNLIDDLIIKNKKVYLNILNLKKIII